MSGQVNSEDQYRAGLGVIKAVYGASAGVLIVDTDEVWDDATLSGMRQAMMSNDGPAYYRTGIWTYLRSPLYRVYPQEPSRVIVGLSSPDLPIGDSRFSNVAGPFRDLPGAIHHMGYVRLDPEEISSKLSNTSSQDQVSCDGSWKQEIWDKLPKGRDLHPVRKVARLWRSVKEVGADSLPTAVTNDPVFWATLGHHRGLPDLSLKDDPVWRERSGSSVEGVETTVPGEFALCLSAALHGLSGGRITQDDCIFLTPRLRMSFGETLQLAEHARQVPQDGQVLEIGSGLGGSLVVIGGCAPARTELYAVDPFEPYDEDNVTLVKGVQVGTVAEFMETTSRMRVDAQLLRATSEDAAKAWNLGCLDLILVDGNHSYNHALHDLMAWWPLLQPGGLLLLHDLSGRFPGVVRAAKEFEEWVGVKFNLPTQSSLAWMRKV
jgi:predicted O-methyltransferase YrrM